MTATRLTLVARLLALSVAVSCSSPGGSNGRPVTRQVIGSAGGTITALGGRVKLAIPPQALASDTAITIQEIDSPSGGNVGQVYDLGPPGTKFSERAQPVQLTLKYVLSDLGGLPPDDLRVATLVSGSWKNVDSTVNSGAPTITGTITHFSPWTLIHFNGVVPPEPDSGTDDDASSGADAAAGSSGAGGSGAAGTTGGAGRDGGAPDAPVDHGAAGTSGAAGKDGGAGTNGAAGKDGGAGTNGAAGTSAAAGTSGGGAGTSGAAGTSAAAGTNGAAGDTGQAGTDGDAGADPDGGSDPDADPDA